MTMQYRIIIGQSFSERQKHEIAATINSTFQETHQLFDKWNPDSELSKLNQLKANIKAPLSTPLQKLFAEAQNVVTLSGGRFDPTIEPVQQLWKQKLQQNTFPTPEELSALAPAIGWDKIHISEGFFYKDHDQTQIDLGGIAKGLCIDRLVENLVSMGYANAFVEWGGEIRANGQHPDQRPWTVYISRLSDNNPNNAISKVFLNDQAIATSGDYEQNWTIRKDGETLTYFHIFDPKTLQALKATRSSIAAASVVAGTCALADGLATSAMLFPTMEEATLWANDVKDIYPEIAIWLITRENIQE